MYLKAFKAIWRMYGLSPNFIFFCFMLVFFRVWFLISHISLFADYLFFPGFCRVKVKNPVFIIGHPRSGTTFLHHLFTRTDEMAAFHAWHVLFPSICARKLVAPLIRYFQPKHRRLRSARYLIGAIFKKLLSKAYLLYRQNPDIRSDAFFHTPGPNPDGSISGCLRIYMHRLAKETLPS